MLFWKCDILERSSSLLIKELNDGVYQEILESLLQSKNPEKNIHSNISKNNEEKIENLLYHRIIGIKEGQYFINVPIFTEENYYNMIVFSHMYSEHFAESIIMNINDIDNHLMNLRMAEYFDIGVLRFVVVGCIALDWHCLSYFFNELIKDRPIISSHPLIFAKSKGTPVLSGVLKNSHYLKFGKFRLVSFGDEMTTRFGVPDELIKRYQKKRLLKEEFKTIHDNIQFLYNDIISKKVRESGFYEYLEEVHIVTNNNTLFSPLLYSDEFDIVYRVIKIIKEIFNQIIVNRIHDFKKCLNHPKIKKQFIDDKILAVEFWHIIFGLCNKKMIEHNYFRFARGVKGYCSFIIDEGTINWSNSCE